MEIRTKRIPIKNEFVGRRMLDELRENNWYDKTDEIKIVSEISFKVPIYEFGTDNIIRYIDEMRDWYLEFPEELTINTKIED